MPDADRYGDQGSDTLGHIDGAVESLRLPNLERLGLGNLLGQHGITGNKGGDGKKRRKQYMFHMTVRQGRTRNCHNEDSMLTRIPGRPSQKGAQAVLFP